MVDEDQPEREPAEQIEPQFALGGHGARDCGGARLRKQGIARYHAGFSRERWSGNLIGNGGHSPHPGHTDAFGQHCSKIAQAGPTGNGAVIPELW